MGQFYLGHITISQKNGRFQQPQITMKYSSIQPLTKLWICNVPFETLIWKQFIIQICHFSFAVFLEFVTECNPHKYTTQSQALFRHFIGYYKNLLIINLFLAEQERVENCTHLSQKSSLRLSISSPQNYYDPNTF